MPFVSEKHSYMLHPRYSHVLLESTNDMDHIITFKGVFCFKKIMFSFANVCVCWWEEWENGKVCIRVTLFVFLSATLLERGRHAAYILLTGPATEGEEGTVVLRKQKLKQEVPFSKVLRFGSDGGPESNEDIKEAFNRLRFSDWWNHRLALLTVS